MARRLILNVTHFKKSTLGNIMNIKSYFVFLCFFSHGCIGFASTYSLFKCNSFESSKSCSSGCEEIGKISFDVRPKSDPNEINIIHYLNNEKSPKTLKNCKIKNKTSWKCYTDGSYSISDHEMVDENYRWRLIYKMLDGKNDVTQGCAK